MTRRDCLKSLAGVAAAAHAQTPPFRIGINTYCLRAMRWNDRQLFDYAASLKLDAVFLQDSLDPRTADPAHWVEVRTWAKELGFHIESGGGGILPRTPEAYAGAVATLRKNIDRSSAIGSPLVRCVIASNRAALPPGDPERHKETVIKMMREVKSHAVDKGVKLAIEVHKDFQAWEHRDIVEASGRDFVGTYLDTGNPVFAVEDPMTTVETLGPYALTLHLRDSVVYEHKRGIAVQWVPLGEGQIDFRAILDRARALCPNVAVYIKPITGRPPFVHPVYDDAFWKSWPRARADEFARFLALAKRGSPYDRPMVVEDLEGRPVPPQFVTAVQAQQRDHMERSVEYAKKTLGLGVRWRNA